MIVWPMMAYDDPAHPGPDPADQPREQKKERGLDVSMSKQQLPIGHPFAARDAKDKDPVTLAQEAILFRRQQFGGWKMKVDDGTDPDDGDDDPDGEDEVEADEVKVGDKVFKIADLQKIMAREKRQGNRSGQTAVLKELGFDSLEAAKAALGEKPKPKPKAKADDDQDDEAAQRAAEREAAAVKREQAATEKARKADLRGALREFGVDRADLDDAFVLLDRAVAAEYDDDDLEDAIEELKKRRPVLFGEEQQEEQPPAQRPTRGALPGGGRGRKPSQQQVFGAAGLERAKRRGFIKD